MTREMGKVLPEARGDVQEAIDVAYYMAGEGRRLFGQTVPSEMPDKFAMAIRRPIGVVGIITPWNFPVAIPAWKLFPALICGNTAVIKPASDTPACLVRFVELLVEGGLPDGVVNVVTGSGGEVGNAIVDHPDVRVISFTGPHRYRASRSARRAAKTLKRVSLELGGKNPIVVWEDADLDLALDSVVWSAFGTSGQRCTAASRLIVHRDVHDDFVHRLQQRVAKLVLGDGLDEHDRCRPGHQRGGGRAHRRLRGHRPRRGRARHRWRASARGRPGQGLVLPADDLHRGQARCAHRAGRDLRPGDVGHSGRRLGRDGARSSTA